MKVLMISDIHANCALRRMGRYPPGSAEEHCVA
jgi:hypothetical protein